MNCRTVIVTMFTLLLFAMYTLPVFAEDDISRHRNCNYCGMDRKAYGYSRMLISYADGTQTGTCSLHCAVTNINAQPNRSIRSLQVADRNTHVLLDATTAFWVTGGRKRGVMAGNPTWAFASLEAAQQFIRDYGGTISTWEEVLTIARKEARP